MSTLLGDPGITDLAHRQMAAVVTAKPSTRWAAYQNHDMGHPLLGHLQFLAVGSEVTFKQAPRAYPDTRFGLGWRYLFVGWVDLDRCVVVEAAWAPDLEPPAVVTEGA